MSDPFALEPLLAPLAPQAPCGGDLEYDPAFQMLQEAAVGKPERQYGATVIPAEPPDWAAVYGQALALAARTRDLRVAVWLTRAAARVEAFGGAVRGLELLRGLVERYWEHFHPALDPSDGNDPTARLNALAPLTHADGLNDLRAARLVPARGSVTVRDIELAFGRAEPLPGEAVPSEDGIATAVAAARAQVPDLDVSMQGGLQAAQGIAQALDARLGAAHAPDFTPLLKLMQCVAQAGRRAPDGAPTQTSNSGGQALATPVSTGTIRSREDAVRALEDVCDWIERNEPTNPAPLLIQRAQRLMRKKNFLEVIRDLVPDGLSQIEKLAGTGRE